MILKDTDKIKGKIEKEIAYYIDDSYCDDYNNGVALGLEIAKDIIDEEKEYKPKSKKLSILIKL